MSWDKYIDLLIEMSEECCDKAVIIALDGGAICTSSTHPNALLLSADEAGRIAHAFKSCGVSAFIQSGIFLGGIKYQFIREDAGSVFAKLKDHGSITMHPTKKVIFIGHTPDNHPEANTTAGFQSLAEKFIQSDS